MTPTRAMLHLNTERMTPPSRPAMPAAAAAIARCCGESILASTPPELFPAASSVGDNPASCPAAIWSSPNNEFDAGGRAGYGAAEPADQRRDQREHAAGTRGPQPNGHCLPRKVHHVREREHRS